MPDAPSPELIRETRLIVDQHTITTPFTHSLTLSAISGIEIWVKFENLQFTASFKDRGAAAKLRSLSSKQQERGVVAMSAGNHAQGVAYHAGNMGIPSTIVMPTTAPYMKVVQTQALGAKVIQVGESVSDCKAAATELEQAHDLTFIHPFDDPLIVAGQGSIGLEIMEQAPGFDTLVAPIGGGGLISGIAIALHDIDSSINVVGVQSQHYDAVASERPGHQSVTPRGQTLADGIAVKAPGELTKPIIESHVSQVLTVDEPAIEQAVNLYLEVEKTVAEGAGACSLAALLQHRDKFTGKRVALILSGGNIDPRLLSSVITRGLVRNGRITHLRVEADDMPGSLALVTNMISKAGANIVEVSHQRLLPEISVRRVDIDVLVETRGARHTQDVIQNLRDEGLSVSIRSE